ncbi:protein phosphatase 1 regulatory subunit 42-like [Cimex lectularius]|uniref:Uncharacterized protein n=1 Tax=Cimex lectularius TaxID=79782 RepID=A0A8I6TJX1_CIMLE|nr:protein phosphatase 1 regulatory subunit 42-like [Cimex lectularius]
MILDDDFVLKSVNLEVNTDDFIEKCQSIRSKSHIKLNKKNIKAIGEAILCRNANVLFLQDNKLSDISNLKQFSRLTHLYLQNNDIVFMDGFQNLVCLEKLYLGSNSISVVENLENCRELEELHIGTQRLEPTEKMIFDPRSIEALAECLLVLNCPGNSISSMKELEKLTSLEELDISCNKLNEIDEVCSSLEKMTSLHTIACEFNPICTLRNYKGKMVMAMPSIKTFNNVDVTRGMYAFYKALTRDKEKKKAKATSSQEYVTMDDIHDIVKELPTGLREVVNRTEDYTAHIDLINRNEFTNK